MIVCILCIVCMIATCAVASSKDQDLPPEIAVEPKLHLKKGRRLRR